eukprot:7347362-Prymnesium_polylepis.2
MCRPASRCARMGLYGSTACFLVPTRARRVPAACPGAWQFRAVFPRGHIFTSHWGGGPERIYLVVKPFSVLKLYANS